MEVAKKTILIVEDDAGLCELLHDSIQDCGFQTSCAQTAAEAFEWLNHTNPALILLDYSLPDMVAREFIAELMERMNVVPPFILATGRGDERIAVEMMKLGARDYIVKDSHFLEMIPMVVTRVCAEIENENKLRLTEQALTESNRFNRQIIDCAQEGIVVYDLNKRIINWNPFMEDITGEKASDILNRYVNEAFPFLNSVGLVEKIDDALQGIVKPALEYNYTSHITGKSYWVSDNVSILQNANGQIIGAISTVRDITERKLAEQEVAKISKHYQAIIENSPDGCVLIGFDGQFKYASPAALRMFGYSTEELIRTQPDDVTHPADLPMVLSNLQRLIGDSTFIPVLEYRFRHKNGEWKWIESTFSNLLNEPAVEGIVINFRDISDRKEAEEALRESEELFKTISANSINAICILNEYGKVEWANNLVFSVSGYSEEDIKGAESFKVFLAPESVDTSLFNFKRMVDGEITDSESRFTILTSTGEKRLCDNYMTYFRDKNGNLKIIAIMTDITERVQAEKMIRDSEQKFRSIAEQTADLIAITDTDGIITYASPAARNLFRIEPEIMCGKNFVEFLDESSVSKAMESFNSSLQYHEKVIDVELLMKRSDGTLFYGELNGTFYAREEQHGTLVVVHDVTERKLAEQELQANRDVLNKLLFASSEFIDSEPDKINYKKICDNILEISGAKYASFNLFDDDGLDFTTVAISGIDGLQDKMKSVFGVELQNKRWKHDPVRAGKLKDGIITRFNNFSELSGFVFSKKISTLVERVFNIGEAWVVQITKNNKTIGDYTLLFTQGNTMKNTEIVELYASQVGLYLERLNSENALRKSEEVYRNLVMRIPDGVYKSTPDGKFLDVNPAMIKMLGYDTKEEMLKLDILSDLYFNAQDRNVRMKKASKDIMSVFQLRKKDGTGIWIEDHGWYNVDKQGNTISHEGVLRDISERKKAEDALLESERLLRESQSIAGLGSYSWDIVTGCWTSSRILDDIFGIGENYSRDTEGWLALIHEDWVQVMSDYIYVNIITNRERFDKEYKIIRQSDGQECWVHGIGELEFNERHEPIKLIGTISNIDDRKQAEIALHEKMNELLNFQRLTVGRELTMIDLKKEVNELLGKLGNDPKYRIVG
jgi:PAS domain S-box-containing protein